jgi:hypothetical protein
MTRWLFELKKGFSMTPFQLYILAEEPESRHALHNYPLDALFENSRTLFLATIRYIMDLHYILIPLVEGYVQYVLNQTEKDRKQMSLESRQQLFELVQGLFEQQYIADDSISDDAIRSNFQRIRHAFSTAMALPLFIREMTFVYLIAKFEDFISKQFRIVFTRIPKILKTKEKSVAYNRLFDASNPDDLKDDIIEQEIRKIMMKDIDEIRKDLKHFLNIDLKLDTDNWNALRECFQRRNILLHNNGKINLVYRQKTGYDGTQEYLSVDKEYLTNVIKLFEECCKRITDRLLQNFSK